MSEWLWWLLGAYLLGSVPFGVLIARAYGIDLRKVGSGNIGATNVSRALGRKWGYVCFALDTLKGLVPMAAAKYAGLVSDAPRTMDLLAWLAVGCAAVVGHIFPVFLKFKGGKGVATGLGVVIGAYPYFTVCAIGALAVWLVCVLIWRMVSLASMIAAAAFPLLFAGLIAAKADWRFAQLWPLMAVAAAMAALIIARHKDNIRRILAGTEHKIFQPKP